MPADSASRDAAGADPEVRDRLREQRARELDDVDCCTRHYAQWVHGRRMTGECSEAIDPEQVSAAAAQDQREAFDGCTRGCRRLGRHTREPGCEFAPPPAPPMPVLPVMFVAEDGILSVLYDPITWEQAAEMVRRHGEAIDARRTALADREGLPDAAQLTSTDPLDLDALRAEYEAGDCNGGEVGPLLDLIAQLTRQRDEAHLSRARLNLRVRHRPDPATGYHPEHYHPEQFGCDCDLYCVCGALWTSDRRCEGRAADAELVAQRDAEASAAWHAEMARLLPPSTD
jgi:hypothetical protein